MGKKVLSNKPKKIGTRDFMRIIFSTFFLVSSFAIFPFCARAQNFELKNGEAKIIIAGETLDSFKGRSLWPHSDLLQIKYPSLQEMLAGAYGQNLEEPKQTEQYSYRIDKIYKFIKGIAQTIDQDKVEPALKIDSMRAVEFTAPQNGIKMDILTSTFYTLKALEAGLPGSNLKINATYPSLSLSQTNSLGINELIAKGESSFKGSPSNRRHNIKIGVEKMTGVIIAKNEEFSFNKYLGPVEKEQGFLPELVIKKDGTVPELGGGLCQVSSTTFRAAMNTGLKITQRKNHAYAVQYYSPQGTDATIYPGIIDLKFINDTPGAILVWPYIKDTNTLIFEFWGTKDQRQVTLHKPEQFDRQPDGSMKATWTRDVFNNGTTTTETFKSTYLSPALFHKQEIFITASATPAALPPLR